MIRHVINKLKEPPRFLNYKLKRVKVNTFPNRLYLETTNVCNLNCIMCPTGRNLMTRRRGFMDFELFKAIIGELAPHIQTAVVHIWGEALLHPRIIEMINYAKNYKISVELSTNATLLNREMSQAILDSRLDTIYLCMDGFKKETYEQIRKKANFEETRQNILTFLELKVKKQEKEGSRWTKPYAFLQIVEMKPTRSEIAEFTTFWNRPGVNRINVKAFDSWGHQVEEINELDLAQREIPNPRIHCPQLWYNAYIYWDGTLVSCDRDFNARYPLGNVHNGVMCQWNGERMMELRKKHLLGQLDDVPACRHCLEWSWWRPTLFKSRGNSPEK